MVNPEEVLQSLDEFSKLKPKDIPRELEEYLMYVAKTGDPVYQWSLVKCLFREKMLNVITDFYESCPSIDLPPCPNVDPFNYETMKASLLERLESFSNAPFTVQRLCELLTTPRKEYTRVDKFMRAIEKNILVVSTKEPGGSRARPDAAAPQPSAADVLMNGVMEGRGGAGGLDIGEAIETVSAEGVNLLHGAGDAGAAAAAEGAEAALGDAIRVECEDMDMDDATAAVWDAKGDGATPSAAWAAKDECTANGEGLKIMDTPAEGSVWGGKDEERLKALSPAPAPDEADAKPPEDEHEAAAVAVVSEFLAPAPDKADEPPPQEQGSEADSKEAAEGKEPESDAESGVSCSADSSSASSDCATAEMNQTLETNGTLEITSVESEVMSPLDGLEDVTSNISPPSPDTGAALDAGETTPPPTFAEMTADEDTQDAVRSADPPDDEDEEEEEDKPEPGTKAEGASQPVLHEEETKMEVDEVPETEGVRVEGPVVEQCVLEAPAVTSDLPTQTPSEAPASEQPDSSVLPYSIV